MNDRDWNSLKPGERIITDHKSEGVVLINSKTDDLIRIQWDDESASDFRRSTGKLIPGGGYEKPPTDQKPTKPRKQK